MKKIFSILLTLFLFFSLVLISSCSVPTDDTTSSNDTCPIIPSGDGNCS